MEILICTLQSIKEVKNRALSLLSEAAHASMVQLGLISLNMFKYLTSKKVGGRKLVLLCLSFFFERTFEVFQDWKRGNQTTNIMQNRSGAKINVF